MGNFANEGVLSMIYLAHAATTSVCPAAVDAAVAAMTQGFGNPSSTYPIGRQAAQQRDEHRAVIEKAFSDVCQRAVTVQLSLDRADAAPSSASVIDEAPLFDAFGRQNVDIMD